LTCNKFSLDDKQGKPLGKKSNKTNWHSLTKIFKVQKLTIFKKISKKPIKLRVKKYHGNSIDSLENSKFYKTKHVYKEFRKIKDKKCLITTSIEF